MKTEQNDPIGMLCEYGKCQRKGNDYVRPSYLSEKGWEDEPIYLCDDHAKELKVTVKIK